MSKRPSQISCLPPNLFLLGSSSQVIRIPRSCLFLIPHIRFFSTALKISSEFYDLSQSSLSPPMPMPPFSLSWSLDFRPDVGVLLLLLPLFSSQQSGQSDPVKVLVSAWNPPRTSHFLHCPLSPENWNSCSFSYFTCHSPFPALPHTGLLLVLKHRPAATSGPLLFFLHKVSSFIFFKFWIKNHFSEASLATLWKSDPSPSLPQHLIFSFSAFFSLALNTYSI